MAERKNLMSLREFITLFSVGGAAKPIWLMRNLERNHHFNAASSRMTEICALAWRKSN